MKHEITQIFKMLPAPIAVIDELQENIIFKNEEF